MSLWDIHYNAIYGSPIAVDAVLTLADTAGTEIPLRAIDKTVGLAAGFGSYNRNGQHFSDVAVMTVRPSCMVRAADLVDVDLAGLRDASITFNGKTWRVVDHEPEPAPTGEGYGEIRLILEAA